MAEIVFRIGGIGHRVIKDQDEFHYVTSCCHKIFSTFKKQYPCIRAVSAIAEGADSIFSQIAISSGIQLDTVIPFEKFEADFKDEESRARYTMLRNSSIIENRVKLGDRSSSAYRKSMEWVVFKSNLVVAIWDGKELGSRGGTWDAINLCKALRKRFIHVNPSENTICLYTNTGDGLSRSVDIKYNEIEKHLNHVNR